MDNTAERYHRSAHSFDIRGKYRAASRLVVEQAQDDPKRKKTARRRFLNANLMIVDQASIFPIFFRFLRELTRPNAAKPLGNSGRVDGISVAEIDPSVEIFQIAKLGGDLWGSSIPAIGNCLMNSRAVCASNGHCPRSYLSHCTDNTLQDPACLGGVQLNTFVPPKAPSKIGKVQLSIPKTAVPMGNTVMIAETGTLFELCTKQTSAPLLFQFGKMRVETFHKVLAPAVPTRARVVATTDAEIQMLNFPNISFPSKLAPPTLTLQ